jgi:hypothetical protein
MPSIKSLYFTKNQNVTISDNTNSIIVTSNQNSSTPGIYKKFFIGKNDKLEIDIELCNNIKSDGYLILSIADSNLGILHIEKNFEKKFSYQNLGNNILNIGILFRLCRDGDNFEIKKFTLTSNGKIGELKNIFSEGYTEKFSYDKIHHEIFVYGDIDPSIINKTLKDTTVVIYDPLGNAIDFAVIDEIKINSKRTTIEPWVNGFGYNESFCYDIPDTIKSGIYLIDKKIPFVVKSDEYTDFIILYPVNTFYAYNYRGGKSLYYYYLDGHKDPHKRSKFVSIQRPPNVTYNAIDKHCHEFFKWMINSGYSHKVITDIDMDTNYLINSKNFVIVGHSEYWTQKARDKLEKFNEKGGNIINFSGNTLWWKIKYNNNRTVINCDKKGDTSTFRSYNQPTFNILGVDYSVGGFGILSGSGLDTTGLYTVLDKNSLIFDKTNLNNGDTIPVPTIEFDGIYCDENGILGPEYDQFKYSKIYAIGDCKKKDLKNYSGIMAVKKSDTHGTVLNTGTMNWCGIIFKNNVVKQITKNIFDIFLESNIEEILFD